MAKTIKLKVGELRINLDGLKGLEAQLKKRYRAKVGILGASARQKVEGQEQTDLTNADIGLIQEKGSDSANIPRRSFLELPLALNMPKRMDAIAKAANTAVQKGDIKLLYTRLGIIGESVVLEAFATSFGGRWAPNAPSTLRQKYPKDKPLINSGQLRQHVSSTVVSS